MQRQQRHLLFILFIIAVSNANRDLQDIQEEIHAFVSKVEPIKDLGWYCDCYNATDSLFYKPEPECRCFGKEFNEVPIDLDENLIRITITDTDMLLLERNSFQPYRFTLQEVVLGNMQNLRVIESGTFRHIPNLRTLYISHAPQINILDGLLDGITSNKFLSLRIVQTSLQQVPDLTPLQRFDNIMHMLDLDSNQLRKLTKNSIQIKAEQVTLNYNDLMVIEDFALNGSQIGKLSLRGNRHLQKLNTNAFHGLKSLYQLDLSETAIEELPINGLKDVEILKIEETPSMKVIPSLYDLPNLHEAFLTHPFHCCAFKYPQQHDPLRHAQYEAKVQQVCKEMQNADSAQMVKRSKRDGDDDEEWGNPVTSTLGYISNGLERGLPSRTDWTPNLEHIKGHPNKSDHSHLNPLWGETIEKQEARPLPKLENIGVFHASSAEINENDEIVAFCGNLTIRTSLIKCYPEPNALNPCEDIMGSYYLRVSVWFVVILAVLGNLAVVVVVLFSGGELTVPRFLMCNLAFADLCMGFYLMFIASMDLHSVGTYFNLAFDWQYGMGCQIAGFLTVFASQLSIFTLTTITVERWFAIAYAIYLTRRIRLGLAMKIMSFGWFYAILMAALPLFGVSNYSSTSICLPMEVKGQADRVYLITMIVMNSLAFLLIVFCYVEIYFSLGYDTRSVNGEMTIAKKMALLVFTDFVCWAPIAFFSLTALAGYPLIGVTRSKILLVFFYPLNSCANPYLYAIMTAQYRKDFFVVLSRLGICKRKVKQYMPTTTNTPLTHLNNKSIINGRKSSGPQSSQIEDVIV